MINIAVYHCKSMSKDNFSWVWIKTLRKMGIKTYIFDVSSFDMSKIRKCDGVMWHWNHDPDQKQYARRVLFAIHYGLKIPIYPNMESSWHYDDKLSQHYLLKSINAPIVPTWIFWSKNEALKFIKSTKFPIVFKLSAGAASSNVILIKSKKEAILLIEFMFSNGIYPYTSFNEYESKFINKISSISYSINQFKDYFIKNIHPLFATHYELQKNYVYFQQFLPNNHYDIRITIIGERAFGVLRHNREKDFRASGSGNFETKPDYIPKKTVKIAFKIAKMLNFTSCAFDFLKDVNGDWLINEISYCHPISMVSSLPGFWDPQMHWHNQQLNPEEVHVQDFISSIYKNI